MFHVRFRLPNDLNQDRRRVELTVLEMFRHKTHPSPAADRLTPITLITTGNQRAYRASNAKMKPLITSSALMLLRQHHGLVVHRVASTAVKGRSFALAAPRSEVAEGHSDPREGHVKVTARRRLQGRDANSRRAPVSLSFARPADPPVPGGVLSLLPPPFPPAASAWEIARII